ncbi:MAG: HAD family phosphatase [Candidatus Peregrinibacteria bacterium]|nr:HAD family phosphatase [Candidatus Peregrinibacteria bacterium]
MQIIFWDMDGVLIDSLGLDLQVINPMLEQKYGKGTEVSRDFIRSKFALAIPEFIRDILLEVDRFNRDDWEWMVQEYEVLRRTAKFKLCPGARDRLEEAKALGFPQWVVSNNREADIDVILKEAGLREFFDRVWGYDSHPQVVKKPAPDIYLGAFESAYLEYAEASKFWVFEDSGMGIESAVSAREIWNDSPVNERDVSVEVMGVATGGDRPEDLMKASRVLDSLESFKFSL